ncbi:hypothetical protein DPMN_055884 [Dreissena polymorpha]|uniref:Uncharacterized protein n=1 Tax=Dreissena polymorpha TaxID=45954 RepID=A0A9D4CTG3_DREPO|nr:hypothetical protein DPMN_055884 [Dreissena polymorpha]
MSLHLTLHQPPLPGLLALHYWGQLLGIPHQYKPVCDEQRGETRRLYNLRGLVYNADVKLAPCEQGMVQAKAAARNYFLKENNNN